MAVLDTLVVVLVSGFVIHAASGGDGTSFTVLLVISLVGFLGTLAVVPLLSEGKR